jgi:hypothetical protein
LHAFAFGGVLMEANFGICLFLLVLLVPFTYAGRATISTTAGGSSGGSDGGSIQKLEVQKHLKNLNRPPVKTIKVEFQIIFFHFLLPLIFLCFLFTFYPFSTFCIDYITVLFFSF